MENRIRPKNLGRLVAAPLLCVVLALGGCSRQQSDWQKTRETNTADAYEQFLKKYPSGEFTAQAQARAKELYEERDWQKARDADTPDAYQVFLKQYPEGKWTEEARIRVENFTLAQAPSNSGPAIAANPESADASSIGMTAPPSAPAGKTAPRAVREPADAAGAGAASTGAVPSQSAAAHSRAQMGSYAVQLGAFKSGSEAASRRWAYLRKEYPALLAGMTSKVLPKKTAGGNLYRLQATGLSEKHAREVCTALKAKAQACLVVPPAAG